MKFNNENHETRLVCLKGKAEVSVDGETFGFAPYDSIYIPRDSEIEVRAEAVEGCDFAEISAPVDNRYPLKFVSFSEDVRKDSTLHFIAGQPPIQRDLNVLPGKNVEAGRIMCGVTFSSEGNWTSFPPHEHAAMLEEAYLYIDMPAPSFGIQMVYNDFQTPELVQVVRESDVVLMPQRNQPNVPAPGGSINFLWMMAANRQVVDRSWESSTSSRNSIKAVAGLTKAYAKEWAKENVNLNPIAPGYFVTNNTTALRADETRNRQILERIPAGRRGEPEDLIGATVFLAATASDYLNGHILLVDGGWMAR